MEKDIFDTLAEKFRDILREEGMTQEKLEELCGLKQQSTSRLLNKKVRFNSIETLDKLVNVFGVPYGYFFGEFDLQGNVITGNKNVVQKAGDNATQIGKNNYGNLGSRPADENDELTSNIIRNLQYAPDDFKEKILDRLKQFKNMSDI